MNRKKKPGIVLGHPPDLRKEIEAVRNTIRPRMALLLAAFASTLARKQ